MKKLLFTVAAAALLAPAAYAEHHKSDHAMEKTQMDKADKDKAAKGMATSKSARDMKRDYGQTTAANTTAKTYGEARAIRLGASEYSGKEMLGEGVFDAKGERIARIDDLLIDDSGRASKVIFLSGGVFGLGGEKGAVDYNRVKIDFSEAGYDDMAELRVSMTEAAKESAAEFEQNGFDDFRLASELIGSKVDLLSTEGDDDDAVINDLIFTRDGRVKYVVVQESMISSIGAGERYALGFDTLGVAEGDGGLLIRATEEQLEAAPRFAYRVWNDARREMNETAGEIENAAGDAAGEIENEAGEVADDLD